MPFEAVPVRSAERREVLGESNCRTGIIHADQQRAAPAIEETGDRLRNGPFERLVHTLLVEVPAQARLEFQSRALPRLAQRRHIRHP